MRKVLSNLLQQDIYIRDCLPAYEKSCPVSKKYFELQRKTVSNGIVEELVECDYPVTQESVNSYLDTSDYRNNPAQAVLNATPRKNLGDIVEVQDFIANNPAEALSIYKQVSEKLSKIDLTKVEQKQKQEQSEGK